MRAERLRQIIRVPSLVFIATAVFLLERGKKDRQTRLNAIPTPAAMPAWVLILETVQNKRYGYRRPPMITDRKWSFCRITPMPLTLNDFQGYFSYSLPA